MANRVFSTIHPQIANRQPINYLQAFEIKRVLDISVIDDALLITALTHSSYLNEPEGADAQSNDRLETLGDAAIDLAVTDAICEMDAALDEGQITLIRSRVVSNETLARVARHLRLGEFLRMGKGEIQSGGADKASNLAGAFEAIVGAIYSGPNPIKRGSRNRLGAPPALPADKSQYHAAAAKFCIRALQEEIDAAYDAVTAPPPKPKSKQRNGNGKPNQPAKPKQRGKDMPAAKNQPANKRQPDKNKQSAKSAGPNINGKHPKSALQEITQAKYGVLPEYRITKSTGKSNAPTFSVEVSFSGKTLGKGSGSGKQDAETRAATQALRSGAL